MGIICPPAPGFYTRPATLEELIDHTLGRLIDVIGLQPDQPSSSRGTGSVRDGLAAGAEAGLDQTESRLEHGTSCNYRTLLWGCAVQSSQLERA
jgi:hypothetical protein